MNQNLGKWSMTGENLCPFTEIVKTKQKINSNGWLGFRLVCNKKYDWHCGPPQWQTQPAYNYFVTHLHCVCPSPSNSERNAL